MAELTIDDLKKQLQEAKKEAAEAQKAAAAAAAEAEKAAGERDELAAQIAAGTATPRVTGNYKGYTFTAGHLRVRNQQGEICDTQKLLDGANAGDEEAVNILDWLRAIEYAYFIPA